MDAGTERRKRETQQVTEAKKQEVEREEREATVAQVIKDDQVTDKLAQSGLL